MIMAVVSLGWLMEQKTFFTEGGRCAGVAYGTATASAILYTCFGLGRHQLCSTFVGFFVCAAPGRTAKNEKITAPSLTRL